MNAKHRIVSPLASSGDAQVLTIQAGSAEINRHTRFLYRIPKRLYVLLLGLIPGCGGQPRAESFPAQTRGL